MRWNKGSRRVELSIGNFFKIYYRVLIKRTCSGIANKSCLGLLIVFIFYVGPSICLERMFVFVVDSVKDSVKWWEKGCWFVVNRVIYWGSSWFELCGWHVLLRLLFFIYINWTEYIYNVSTLRRSGYFKIDCVGKVECIFLPKNDECNLMVFACKNAYSNQF